MCQIGSYTIFLLSSFTSYPQQSFMLAKPLAA